MYFKFEDNHLAAGWEIGDRRALLEARRLIPRKKSVACLDHSGRGGEKW